MSRRRVEIVIFLLQLQGFFGQECFDDGNEFCVDRNDILSADLLPGSFLLMEQREAENDTKAKKDIVTDGTFDVAFYEMEYHRKRMNEYLCHGFIAEEIFKEVGPPRIKRRLVLAGSTTDSLDDFLGEENVTIHDKLLSDEGSSKYKNWLQRTTTLNDIYRHYAPRRKAKKKQGVRRDDDDEEDAEEFDGEVTGYAMPAPLPSGKIGGGYFEPSGDRMISSASGHNYNYGDYFGHHGEFFPTFHEEHHYTVPNHHVDDHEHYHRPVYHGKGKGHDLSTRDFFEIALTALAFLAFGLFLIQLIMNVTNTPTVTAAAFVQADIDGSRYKRRASAAPPLSYAGNAELNEMSHRVLRSIEAALVAERDGGNCLRRVLCEDNSHSKETTGGQRIWMPVWSLGMSWISGRVQKRSRWSAMLDSVNAAVLGLGGADCVSLYPRCDLRRERIKRRRRRRK